MARRVTARQPRLKWHQGDFDVRDLLKPDVKVKPSFETDHGALFGGDCMRMLHAIRDEVVDTVFADPPFNLGKKYGEKTDDSLPDPKYLAWCKEWMDECVRVLKPGGAFFLYNLPRWNILLGAHLFEK